MENSKRKHTSSARKLAAILFADIVGYTSLMQHDEQNASTLLRHFQKQLEEKVATHNGTIVNFYGDGALCTFQIPLDAIRCAMDLQTTFQSAPAVPVRVGIHSGTVTQEGDKIFGDSVNIASRIESMGVGGSILLSRKVRNEVKNNPDLQMQSLGSFEFKNVEEPMEVFALANEGFTIPAAGSIPGKVGKKSKNRVWLLAAILAVILIIAGFSYNKIISGPEQRSTLVKDALSSEEASIAVLPFKNMSADEEQQYFSDGISEEILNALTQLKDLKVSARSSSFQFRGEQVDLKEVGVKLGVNTVLEGSVRKSGNRIRIIAQLINIENGFQLWSERYDRQLTDVFTIQDEIAQAIVEQLKLTFAGNGSGQLVKALTENQEAYDLYLKGWHFYNLAQFSNAVGFFEDAIELDPEFAAAHAALSITHFGLTQPIGRILDTAMENKVRILAEKSIELDSTLALARSAMASIYHDYDNDYYKAQQVIEKILETRPTPDLYYHLAHNTIFQGGDTQKAIDYAKKAVKLDPLNVLTYFHLAVMYHYGRREKEALALIEELKVMFPGDPMAHITISLLYHTLKDYNLAFQYLHENQALLKTNRFTFLYFYNLSFMAKVNPEQARIQLQEFKDDPEWKASPYAYAAVHLALGEKEQAYQYLDEAFELGEFTSLRYLKFESLWDDLRGEPRFEAMLERLVLKD